MNSDVHDCSRCACKMREGKQDFMAIVENEIVVIKDVLGVNPSEWTTS
jgi:hypothetical protein